MNPGADQIMPNGQVVGTCADCYTWRGTRGSAHDPETCSHRKASIDRVRTELRDLSQRLANLTGSPVWTDSRVVGAYPPSIFNPTVEEMREATVEANCRAENLAGRIGQARRAIRSGQSNELVLAILDGKAERPDDRHD